MGQDEQWGFEVQSENGSDRGNVSRSRRERLIPTVAASRRTRENVQEKRKGLAYTEMGGERSGEVCQRRAPNVPADRGTRRAITREAMFHTVATVSFVAKGNEEARISGGKIYIRGTYHYLWWGNGPCRSPAGMGDCPNVRTAHWLSLATQFSTRLLAAFSKRGENAYNLLVSPEITM